MLRRRQRGFPTGWLAYSLAIYPDFPPSKVAKLSIGSKRYWMFWNVWKKNPIYFEFCFTSKFSFKVSGTSEIFWQKLSTKKKRSNFDETRIFINSKRFQEKKIMPNKMSTKFSDKFFVWNFFFHRMYAWKFVYVKIGVYNFFCYKFSKFILDGSRISNYWNILLHISI